MIYITREQMIEIDRIMVEYLSIEIPLMMEHAGLNLARIVLKYLDKTDKIVICVGSGNNGGGGLVAARRLFNWGYDPIVWLAKGEPKNSVAKIQFDRIKRLNIRIEDPIIDDNTIVVDAFIGYNFKSPLKSDAMKTIDRMKMGKIICLDIASGVDSNTGINEGKIEPLATATLAWPKSAFNHLGAKYSGDLYLVDIGVPINVYVDMGIINDDEKSYISDFFVKSSYSKIHIEDNNWQFKWL